MKNGKIIQVMGPVVDVKFDDGDLPYISDALEVFVEEKKRVMEVAQHIGDDVARCIMLSPSEGLCKDMTVYPTGGPISVPVGEKVLGRLFNVLGEPIDNKGDVEAAEKWQIHRDAP
ncbi:MAG: F0F1 ATP synthase subunit beta, partial [Butyrivibrio sp.]|nr:F0F1 ATP synthase subunit beta [Butyrivibrio sp.]